MSHEEVFCVCGRDREEAVQDDKSELVRIEGMFPR